MKYSFFVLLFILTISYTGAQVEYQNFSSLKLNEDRELKIQLPRGYDADADLKYPLIVVLDGDYLFEPVAGTVDYFSYWEDMPPSIVVGVNQLNKRFDDSMYSEQTSLPIRSGAAFFEFLGLELIPYIEKTYKTGSFNVIVGHGETANFINYYLLKENPLFQSYVVISPDFSPKMPEFLQIMLNKITKETFYYLSNTNNDKKSIKVSTDALNTTISAISNDKLFYNFNNFKDVSHYSVPANAIPVAFEKMFKVYQPISRKEYQEVILELETSPVLYLQEKYAAIYNRYGVEKPILLNDFMAIAAAIEKKETFEYYEELGEMASKTFPKTLLGPYYLARFYEETGETKRAMIMYKSAYDLKEIGGITKDDMFQKADLIKSDFGY